MSRYTYYLSINLDYNLCWVNHWYFIRSTIGSMIAILSKSFAIIVLLVQVGFWFHTLDASRQLVS